MTTDTKPEDGGPAFPVTYEHAEATAEYHGMSLRDYFAAKAMQEMNWYTEDKIDDRLRLASAACYRVADAMIAARNA